MPNRVLNKSYLTRQFAIYDKTVFGVIVKDALETLENKVDKVVGYGLSKNDFTDVLKEKLDNLEAYNDAELYKLIGENENALEILNGGIDDEGSVAHYVKLRIEEITKDAPERFDTIKEISDWIVNHTNSALNMKMAIDKNTLDLMEFQKRWDEYGVLIGETEQLDFTNDEEFCRYEWFHVVPDSIKFVGSGSLTDSPSDYIISVLHSKQSVSGRVYDDSEAITASLADMDVLGFTVNISNQLNMNTTRIEVIGLCAGSSSYEVGKVDTVVQEFHEWTYVDDSTLVTNEDILTAELEDYSIQAYKVKETGPGEKISTDLGVVTLTEVRERGSTVNVELTDGGNSRKVDISIKGVDVNKNEYSGIVDTLEYSLKDWFVVLPNTLTSLTTNLTNNVSDYTIDLVHYKQAADGTLLNSEPATVTLGEAESLGFDVKLEFTDDGNGRTVDVTIGGVDITSSTYKGEEVELTKTLSDWYTVVASTIAFTKEGDLTTDTSDYTVNVYRSERKATEVVNESLGAKTLSDLIALGFDCSVTIDTELNNGAVNKTAHVVISGVGVANKVIYTGAQTSVDKYFYYHEWYDTDYAVDLGYTGSGDYTNNKDDYKLNIAYCKENDSGTVYSNEPKSITLTEAEEAGLTTTVNVVTKDGGSVSTVTVSGAGISDNSQNYSGELSTKTFVLKSWTKVGNAVKFLGTGSLTTNEHDYGVDIEFYKESDTNSSIGTRYGSLTNVRLDELSGYGLDHTFETITENNKLTVDVSISGVSSTSTTSYSSDIITQEYSLHEWVRLSDASVLSLTNLVDDENSYKNCTVSNVSRIIETSSNGTTTVPESNVTYTIEQLENANVSCEFNRSVTVDNGQYQNVTTLTCVGTNLLSSSCINTVQSKTLTVKNYATYAESAGSTGSSVPYSSAIKWESDD